jgi:hypothetical protein
VKKKIEVLYAHEAEHNMEIVLVTQFISSYLIVTSGPSSSCDSRIKHYLCNQCLSTPMLRVRFPLSRGILET